MDDAWHLKCGPTWPPPLSIPPAPSTVVPPAPTWPFLSTPQQPMQVPAASGSANEVNMSSRYPFHPPYAQQSMLEQVNMSSRYPFHPPYAQQSMLEGRSIVQGSFGDMLNQDPSKSGDTELGYSFLALLSGSNQISGEFSQLSNSKSASTKQHVSSGGIVGNGMSNWFHVTSIPPLSDQNVNGTTANGDELSSFMASRSMLMSKRTKTPPLHDNTLLSGSHCHTVDSAKLVPHQAFQGVKSGFEVSATRPGWPTVTSPTDASKHNTIDTQTTQKVSFEAMPSAFHNASAFSGGYPLVFCMNTVGELFVSDRGLFGVTCFCHRLCMSVAKFCEHSGSSSNTPGKAVRLENGMTVAQWRNLCFGIMDPDDGNGWNWSEGLKKGGSVRCAASNTPSLLKNSETVNPIEAFGGLQRSKETLDKFVFANNPCIAVGQTAPEKSINKEAGDAQLKNNLGGHNFLHNNFSSSTQRGMPTLAKNQSMQPVKAIPFSMGLEESHLSLCKGDNSIAYQIHDKDANFFGTCGNLSVPYPSSGTKKASFHNCNISGGNCSTEAFVVDNSGASSNMELRLGQPSQGNHIFAGSPPTAMLQFGALHNSEKAEKPQLNQPLTQGTGYSRAAKRPRKNLQCAPSEPSISKRRQMQHGVGTLDTDNHSKPEETMGDTTKNSLISLFLSHLEGNNQSQTVVDIFNNSENYLSRMPDADSLSVECNLSNSPSDIAKKVERKSATNGSDISKDIANEKGMRVVDDGKARSNSSVHNKHMSDARVLASVVNGHFAYSSPFVDDWRSSLHFNQASDLLKIASDARNSNQCGKVSLLSNGNHFNVIHKSTKPDPHATMGPVSQNSETPSSTSVTNPWCISKAIPSLPNKYGYDTSQHLMDENFRTLALGHFVDLSKLEQSSTFPESTPQYTNLCCLSSMKMQKNVCQDDQVSSEELRQRPHCNIHDDVSRISLKSGHLCSNFYSSSGAEMIAHKPGFTGPNNCCDCTTSIQRVSLCSKEHSLQYPTCHVCGADDQHCLRLGRLSNNKVAEGFENEIYNHRERSPCLPGKCCCCVHSKCVRGCCILSSHSTPDPSKERHICGEAQMMHTTPTYDKDQMFRDGKRIRLGQCECLNNRENDSRSALWRDVPKELVAQSDGGLTNKPSWVVETSRAVSNRVADGAVNEFDGTHQELDLRKEQHMSNISSRSSAPAVTEESDEVDNLNISSSYTKNGKAVADFPVDEGSEIERCGSSGEALGSRKCEQVLTFKDEVDPAKSRSYFLPSHSSGNLIDGLLLKKSPQSKRIRCEISAKSTDQENIIQRQQCERYSEPDSGSNPVERDTMDLSNPESDFSAIHSESPDCFGQSKLHLSSSQGIDVSPCPDNAMQKTSASSCKSLIFKRKRSASSSTKLPSLKRSENYHRVWESDKMQAANDDQSFRASKAFARKKSKLDLAVGFKEDNYVSAERPPKFMLLSCIANTPSHQQNIMEKKVRPVVCGNSGIISSGGISSQRKPAKIVSLSMILKKAKKCGTSECNKKPRQAVFSGSKNARLTANGRHYNGLSFWKVRGDAENPHIVQSKGLDPGTLPIVGKAKGYSGKSDGCAVDSSVTMKETDSWGDSTVNPSMHRKQLTTQTNIRYKDMLECSLNKLRRKGRHAKKKAICLQTHGKNSYLNSIKAGVKHQVTRLFSQKMMKSAFSTNMRSVNNSQNYQDHASNLCQISKRRYGKSNSCSSFLSVSDAFCCVCGSSDQEDVNKLLGCNKCLIKVHQACYGVSKVPKGHWSCRPCKMNSQNIVCVLCGYEGGAMTRALKSQNIVKSLLKAWKVDKGYDSIIAVPSSSTGMNESLKPSSLGEASACDRSGSALAEGSLSSHALPAAGLKINLLSQTNIIQHCEGMPKNFQAFNSVIAGALDPAVTQWVHMVCGLWTPGTRCPNVDTMSAFDVSCASPARKNAVCSMCNRPGGSCIKCRVSNCYVLFHPWCAHQKGLLQSEIEGVDNEKVGFYGRCLLHATLNSFHVDNSSVDSEIQSPKNSDWTCARTEAFKGRKREGGWNVKYQKRHNDSRGCIVSQEQINAWLHINGQKSCPRRVVKPPCSDIEYDFRKEYIRYKQSKGWRHLVVYKSGIHALGLYTSQFIARGAMVVEYVGEIVGLRVADKREIEYQSGRRLQYKSACYFFRIDKEHIIDATRKGGIARFVNHSCLPNCVAKVISVRNEKKVVFFAERDIYPGEEITYDYHFNHEDDCQKIPCFCNSKNCRRYLN